MKKTPLTNSIQKLLVIYGSDFEAAGTQVRWVALNNLWNHDRPHQSMGKESEEEAVRPSSPHRSSISLSREIFVFYLLIIFSSYLPRKPLDEIKRINEICPTVNVYILNSSSIQWPQKLYYMTSKYNFVFYFYF